jgi:NhaP-type Na+/H+ or K+/H+ antiporter
MAVFDQFTTLVVFFFISILVELIAKKIKINTPILLIPIGFMLDKIYVNNLQLFFLSPQIILSVIILVLVLSVFNNASIFSIFDMDTYSEHGFKLLLVILSLNLLLLTMILKLVLGVQSLLLCMFMALIISLAEMAQAGPSLKSGRVADFMKTESIVNTAIIIVLASIIMGFIMHPISISSYETFFTPFAEIVLGVGAGLLVGIILLGFMKTFHHPIISPLFLFGAAVFAYIIATKLSGNGIIAAAVFGMLFEKVELKQKSNLKLFFQRIYNLISPIIFLLLGTFVSFALIPELIMPVLILFFSSVLLRFFSVLLLFINEHFNFKEVIFMSISSPKDVCFAALMIYALLSGIIPKNTTLIADAFIILLVFSNIVSYASIRFFHEKKKSF